MSEEYSDPTAESEMRRRAAWLLAMLVLVAVVFVALMVVFLKGGSNNQAGPTGPALPTGPVGSTGTSTPGGSRSTAPTSKSSASKSSSPSRSATRVHQPPESHRHRVTCSSQLPCVAPGDIGGAVAAVNSYRQQHGQPPVNGRVSDAAQQCALTNGGDCHGEWAESQVPDADGKEAVQKVLPFAQSILDPALKSIEVGWAYDPAAREYYFAIIQNT